MDLFGQEEATANTLKRKRSHQADERLNRVRPQSSTIANPTAHLLHSYTHSFASSTDASYSKNPFASIEAPTDYQLFKPHDPHTQACHVLQPCNNPECEDIQPCEGEIDPCLNPQECLGNICYDESCSPEVTCEQNCEAATRCVTPCYSDACGVPACQEPCASGLLATSASTIPKHDIKEHEAICESSTCAIPGIECVDPQCLSLDYAPVVHKHHVLDDFYKFGGFWHPDACQQQLTDCCDCSTVTPGFQDVSTHNTSTLAYTHDLHPHPQLYTTPASFQPLVDWTNLPGAFQHPGLSSPIKSDSTVPSLSHSLAATPTTTNSQQATSIGTTTPTTSRYFQPGVCLWMSGMGAGAKPCGAAFANTGELHAHVEQVHIDSLRRNDSVEHHEGYLCHWQGCARQSTNGTPAAFAARPKLKRHLQTHTMHKPFICQVCGMSMKTKDAMEKHERTHTGERPYRCPLPGCNKVFATSTELKTHEVVHSGRKPHVCPICNEGFADSSNLSKHKKTHFIGMYRCPEQSCSARMKRWDQMRRHIASQGHGKSLLEDAAAQKEYKARMEREWKSLPDAEKLPVGER